MINGKIYIGQDSNNDNNYFGSGILLKKAIKKYGKKKFKKEILEICNSKKSLDEREVYFIDLYNSIKNGYNLSVGGTGGPNFKNKKHTDETKKKLVDIWKKRKEDINFVHNMTGFKHSKKTKENYSINRRGKRIGEKNPMFGKTHSIESRKKMSFPQYGENNPMYGKTHSEETRKKISEKNSNNKNPMYGKTHSEETRKKMSEKAKGRKSKNSKKITINGVTFNSLTEASKILKISLYKINKEFMTPQ